MSFLKAFGSLSIQSRSLSQASLNPKKFTSILANIPKKNQSAWQIYMSQNITNYKLPSGKIDLKKATETLGATWRTMGVAEKKIYQDQYEAEVKAYKKSMEEALSKATPEDFKQENELRKKYNLKPIKDPRQPKHGKNSFLLYIDHLRSIKDPAVASPSLSVQVSEAAKKYKSLSEDEKKVYTDQSKAARDEYKKKMEEYKGAGLQKA